MSEVQKKHLHNSGVEIYYEVCAVFRHSADTACQQNVLFFLHGLGGDLDAWQFVRDPLLASGFSTIAMDLRGNGYSGHPTARSAYKMELLIADVLMILEAEQLKKVVMVGHSGGAVLALQFALQNPQKLAGLVLLAGSYGPPHYLRSPVLRHMSNTLIAIGAWLSPKAIAIWHSTYPVGKFHKEYELWGLARTIYHNSLRSYLLTLQQLASVNLKDEIRKLRIPTLIVAGEKDGIYPTALSQYMHEHIAGSTLAVVKNANHVLILNNPREVVDLIIPFAKELQK